MIHLAESKDADYPETKHIYNGNGVFGWFNALKSQRKLWCKISIPSIRFVDKDPDIAMLAKGLIRDELDINLSKILEDALNDIFTNTTKDENESGSDEEDSNIGTTDPWPSFPFKSKRHIRSSKNLLQSEQDCTGYTYYDLFGDLFGGLDFMSCQEKDDFWAAFFTVGLVVVPLAVMWAIALLVCIFQSIFCCCCCRAKQRTFPSIVAIVFFGIAATLMVLGTIFMFVGWYYVNHSLSYIKSVEFEDVAVKFINDLNHTAGPIVTDIANDISDLLDELISDVGVAVTNTTDDAGAVLDNILEILNDFNGVITTIYGLEGDLVGNGTESINGKIRNFNQCIESQGGEPIDGLPDQIFSDQLDNIYGTLNTARGQIDNFRDLINNSANTINDIINNNIAPMKDEIKDLGNGADLSDFVEKGTKAVRRELGGFRRFIDNYELKTKTIPVYGKVVKILTIIECMLAIPTIYFFMHTITYIAAFWTKSCCSRCIATCGCCTPCACSFCHLMLGLTCTMMGCTSILFADILINQTSEIFTAIIDAISTEGNITIPPIDLSEQSNGILTSIELKPIQLKRTSNIIKSFIDAELDTPLSEMFALEDIIPLTQIGQNLNESLREIQPNSSFITDQINSVTETFNFEELKDITSGLFKENINTLLNNIIKTYEKLKEEPEENPGFGGTQCLDRLDGIDTQVETINNTVNQAANKMQASLDKFEREIQNVSQTVEDLVKRLVANIMGATGNMLARILSSIYPLFDNFQMRPIIGAINIFRSIFIYDFVGAMMCRSLAAHLLLPGAALMSLCLLVRRRGMRKDEAPSDDSYSYTSGYGSYYSTSDKDSKSVESITDKSESKSDYKSESKSSASDTEQYSERDLPDGSNNDTDNSSSLSKHTDRTTDHSYYSNNAGSISISFDHVDENRNSDRSYDEDSL